MATKNGGEAPQESIDNETSKLSVLVLIKAKVVSVAPPVIGVKANN